MRKKYRYYSVIEGIGINFLTDNFIQAKIDDSFQITDQEAIFMAKYVYEKEGIFIGGSSAVNLCCVLKAAKIMGKGKSEFDRNSVISCKDSITASCIENEIVF